MNIDSYTVYHIDRLLGCSAFTNKPKNDRCLFFMNTLPKVGESIQGINIWQCKNESVSDALYCMLTQKPNMLDFNYQKVVSLDLIKEDLRVKSYKAIVEDVRLVKKRCEISIIAENNILIFKHLGQR